MKHPALTACVALTVCVALSACASNGTPSSDFGPAYGSDFGYRNTQIQNDRFRISYTSRDPYQSRDFALLRAAQIAENEGYSHFKILHGDFYDNGPNPIGAGLGVGLGGWGGGHSNVGIGVQNIERTLEGRKVTETIEVILLSSAPTPPDRSVYDAQSLIRNIVPRNLMKPHTVPPTVVTP